MVLSIYIYNIVLILSKVEIIVPKILLHYRYLGIWSKNIVIFDFVTQSQQKYCDISSVSWYGLEYYIKAKLPSSNHNIPESKARSLDYSKT